MTNNCHLADSQYGHSTVLGPVHFIPVLLIVAPQLEHFCGTLGIKSDDVPLVSLDE